ncbi:MAG: metal ABC transporter ATP-binding protein [Ignisphaera sp.]
MVELKLENIIIGYNKPIISDISITLKSPALVQVMGPNGAGKTTLLKTIIGVIKPLGGKVFVDKDDITGNPEKAGVYIGYVPQIATYVLGNVFPISVWEFVEFEAEAHMKRFGLRRDNLSKFVEEVLNTVGIPKELWHKGINKLSGGQRQRLLVARALIKNTPILALDEPLSAIDVEGRTVMANIFSKLKEDNRIIIITCHDPELLINFTDYVILLGKGMYVFGEPEEVLKPSVLSKLYYTSYVELEKHIHICDYHI